MMKDKFKKLINLNLENVRKVPLTIIFTIIFVIVITIKSLLENKYLLNELSYLSSLFMLIIINLFFTEVSFKKKKSKIIGYVLSFVIAIILKNLQVPYHLLRPKCEVSCLTEFSDYMNYVLGGYVISIISISVFNIYKKLKISFSEYTNKVLSNIFKTGIIFFVSLPGIMFIFILMELVLDVDYKIEDAIYTLLFGLYFIPSIIISLIDVNNDKISMLFKSVNTFCILPVTVISILIIYFYIFKILITKVMPENLIFMLVSIVFIIGMISYFCCNNKNKLLNLYFTVFPYTFIMPIILQIYSVNIRLMQYGLTPDRYIACMFIVFEIIVIFLLIYKKGLKIQNILIALPIICIISVVGPFNLVRMSYISQANILNKYYNDTGDKYSKAVSAYKYLNQTDKGKKYISKEVKNSNIKYEILDKSYNRSNFKHYHLKSIDENINISNYKSMIPVKITLGYDIIKSYSNNLVTVNNNTNSKIDNIDISKYTKMLVLNNYLDNDSFSKNNIYKVDDNRVLYLYYLYLRVNEDNNSIRRLQAKGYLFEK